MFRFPLQTFTSQPTALSRMLAMALVQTLQVTGLFASSVNVSQLPVIQAVQGQSVTATCLFRFTNKNYTTDYGKWFRQNDGQDREYIKSLHHCEPSSTLYKCNVTVQFPAVTLMDAGHYNCEIKVPSPMNPVDNVGNGTELVVHAPPSMSDIIKSAETVMADISIRLTCKVNDFFPETISIVWYLQNTRMTNGVKSMPPLKGSEGEFSVYSHLMLTPKAKDQGLNFTCQVHHITLSAPMSRSISLSVKYAPTNQTLYHRSSDQDKPRVLSRRRIYTPPGSYLELQCVVESQPESVVKWLNPGGTMLSNASNSNATLTLNPVQESDEGMYECSATNDYGSEKMKIRIDVNPESTLAVRLVTYPLFVIIVSSLLLYSRFCKDHFQSIFINAEENETLETDNLPQHGPVKSTPSLTATQL